jgi:hypothetical protein
VLLVASRFAAVTNSVSMLDEPWISYAHATSFTRSSYERKNKSCPRNGSFGPLLAKVGWLFLQIRFSLNGRGRMLFGSNIGCSTLLPIRPSLHFADGLIHPLP